MGIIGPIISTAGFICVSSGSVRRYKAQAERVGQPPFQTGLGKPQSADMLLTSFQPDRKSHRMVAEIGQARVDDRSARMLGIAVLCVAWLMFSGLDASGKFPLAQLAVMQIVAIRYAGGLVYSIGLIAFRRNYYAFRTAVPLIQLTRGSLLALATSINFVALQYLQLDQSAAIMFSIPLIVCLLSVPLLGEQVGWRRYTAVAVGFIGVIIIIRPGFDGFHWAMLLVVLQATCAAFYMILTRKAAAHDRDETSLLFVGLVGTAATLPFGIANWQPLTAETIIPVLLICICGGLGHHLVIMAHRLAPAPVLAPFGYTHIIWMTLLGYLLFGDVPDEWTLLGAGIVIACGLFLLYRERQIRDH